jgi:dolichol-phosphate mannosyltransferase
MLTRFKGFHTPELADLDLSIVVPAYNEEENVRVLAEEVLRALEGMEFEILFVDDGSRDRTVGILAEMAAVEPRLRVIRHRGNFGQSAALISGVRQARAPWIATLDGDGQNDPADIPRLFAATRDASQAPVCICGARLKRRDTYLKRVSSRVANGVRSRLLRDGIKDTGCGLKLFQREAFLDLPRFNHMHRFLPALFLRDGGSVLSVPVNHRPRLHGTSKYGLHNRLWVGLVDLLGVLWLQRRGLQQELYQEEYPS